MYLQRAYLDFSIPGLSWDTVLTAPYMQAFGFWLLRDGLVPGAKVSREQGPVLG